MRPKCCPRCGSEDFVVLLEEVDIGVGTQTFLRGGTCRTCGEIAVCGSCSAWDSMPHSSWCDKEEEGRAEARVRELERAKLEERDETAQS